MMNVKWLYISAKIEITKSKVAIFFVLNFVMRFLKHFLIDTNKVNRDIFFIYIQTDNLHLHVKLMRIDFMFTLLSNISTGQYQI